VAGTIHCSARKKRLRALSTRPVVAARLVDSVIRTGDDRVIGPNLGGFVVRGLA